VNGVRQSLRWAVGSAALILVAAAGGAVAARSGSDYLLALAAMVVAAGAVSAAVLAIRLRAAATLALRDPLTDLPNRVLLDDRVEQALRRTSRTGEPFVVVALDLDGFKEVNDIRGHRAGDEVLRRLARRLEEVVRASDTVARVGGDEFVVLSLGTSDEDEAAALVARLRQSLRRPIEIDGVTLEIDASIGWALHPSDGSSLEELLGRADGQMYATKRDTSADTRRGSLDAGIVREFEHALERRELVVHYQPILRLSDGSVNGIEALVRRFHPERGVVSPADFIPHVERTALIREVTLFVAEESLRTVRDLKLARHSIGASINVPYRAVDDGELAAGLQQLLEATGVDPSSLTLEIVPSGPGAGGELDRDALASLRALGVRVSLDDFGRASSLAAVRVLPLDQVKIDAGFVHGLGRNLADSAVVVSLASLGHELGLEVVAEGVETRLAWDQAAACGCDLAQGYYALRPCPRDELVAWLETGWPAVTPAPAVRQLAS
jgi:diguanylate cyclase (GGDEF)-like protein